MLLPKSTPASLSITALDGVKIKEFGSEIIGRMPLARYWPSRSATAFGWRSISNSRSGARARGLALPIVRADGVAYQSGLMAVEGLRGTGRAGRYAGPAG